MSDEYEIKFVRDVLPDIGRLAQSIRQSVAYELVGVENDAVQGAYRRSPSPDWPEDFTVLLRGPMKLISVHGGTSAQRQRLLADLQIWLRDQGLHCELEELSPQGLVTRSCLLPPDPARRSPLGLGVNLASGSGNGQAPNAAKMAIGAAGGAAGAAVGGKIANSAAAKLASDAAKPGVAGHIGQTTQAAAQLGGKVVVPTSVGQGVGQAGADAAAAGASKLAEKELIK
jgi:hypothetical protein